MSVPTPRSKQDSLSMEHAAVKLRRARLGHAAARPLRLRLHSMKCFRTMCLWGQYSSLSCCGTLQVTQSSVYRTAANRLYPVISTYADPALDKITHSPYYQAAVDHLRPHPSCAADSRPQGGSPGAATARSAALRAVLAAAGAAPALSAQHEQPEMMRGGLA